MRLFFIRHGQSVNNALWDESGSNNDRSEDPELTDTGVQQARILAKFLVSKDRQASISGEKGEPKRDYFGFTHLYTSLMVRSVATATMISQALGLPLVAWPEIHECGGMYLDGEEEGVRIGMPGKTRSYFAEHYHEMILPESVTDQGWWNRPFEPDESRALRAQHVLETLLERHGNSNDRVAIVSHGAFYMELMRVMFKINELKCWYLMYNTAVSRFDFHASGEITLAYHNRTDHLPEHLIT
jgi:2,3-bisphosphoglycerate-dependent phosphoglycerate mutase